MFDVISFGAATVDIFAKSKQFLVKDDLLSLVYSSKSEIDQSLICAGGGATNSSVSFSRLGLQSACVSLIGDDHLSGYILDDLKKEKVNFSQIIKSKKDTTDFSIILVAPDGGRTILTNRGDSRLEESQIKWSKLKSRWFYITSLEGNLDLLEKIIGFAKESSIKVAFNPGNRELSQKRYLKSLLKHVDFLLLNKTESEILTDSSMDEPDFWSKLNSYKSGIIAITNGREGAHVLVDSKTLYSPIINTKPVDETGAGDSFGSAFVAALIYGFDSAEALFWGVKNSASVVFRLGAQTGLLTKKQIHKS